MSKVENQVISISKHDAQESALKSLMTTKQNVEENKKQKEVRWEDNMRQQYE